MQCGTNLPYLDRQGTFHNIWREGWMPSIAEEVIKMLLCNVHGHQKHPISQRTPARLRRRGTKTHVEGLDFRRSTDSTPLTPKPTPLPRLSSAAVESKWLNTLTISTVIIDKTWVFGTNFSKTRWLSNDCEVDHRSLNTLCLPWSLNDVGTFLIRLKIILFCAAGLHWNTFLAEKLSGCWNDPSSLRSLYH